VFGVRSAGWETSGLRTSVGALERGAAGAVTLAGGGGWCRPVVVEPEVEVLCPARAFVEPGLSGSGVFAAAPGAGAGAAWGWAPTVWPLVGTGCAAVTGTGSGWGAPAAAPEPPEAADALGCAWTAVRTWLAIALPSAAAGTAAAGLCGMAATAPAGTALWAVGITDESSADAGPAAIRSAPIDASMPTSPRSFGNFELAISNFCLVNRQEVAW
jgi:hypothetical protein